MEGLSEPWEQSHNKILREEGRILNYSYSLMTVLFQTVDTNAEEKIKHKDHNVNSDHNSEITQT